MAQRIVTMLFRVVWIIDVIAAAIAVVFFCWGLVDGSVSDFNILLWVLMLGGLAAVVFGSRALFERGRRSLALALAIVPALPTIGFGALIVAMMMFGGNWR